VNAANDGEGATSFHSVVLVTGAVSGSRGRIRVLLLHPFLYISFVSFYQLIQKVASRGSGPCGSYRIHIKNVPFVSDNFLTTYCRLSVQYLLFYRSGHTGLIRTHIQSIKCFFCCLLFFLSVLSFLLLSGYRSLFAVSTIGVLPGHGIVTILDQGTNSSLGNTKYPTSEKYGFVFGLPIGFCLSDPPFPPVLVVCKLLCCCPGGSASRIQSKTFSTFPPFLGRSA
jgi:hypothetical protein